MIAQLQKVKIAAYYLGERIHLKDFKKGFEGTIHSESATEIFISTGEHSYVSIQISGEIAFSNCDEKTIREFIDRIKNYIYNPISFGKEYKEDFVIDINPDEQLSFKYNSVTVPQINTDVIKIVMLNVSQSVVLDYFTELSQDFLLAITKFAQELEVKGKLSISNKRLMKFIGKTLNTQNRIIDNLYFIDAPDIVWDNEYLSKINHGLSGTFNIKTRFKEVEYMLQIIDNNLRTFTQLSQNRYSNNMEWIIVFLILFEILHAIFK